MRRYINHKNIAHVKLKNIIFKTSMPVGALQNPKSNYKANQRKHGYLLEGICKSMPINIINIVRIYEILYTQ